MKRISTRQKLQQKNDLIFCVLLMTFAFLINRSISIRGLYMDDLYLWSCYGEQSFFQYVFPIGSTRFRFLYYLAAWLELAATGSHFSLMVPINIALNGLIACFLYWFGRQLSGRNILGFLAGFMYLLSRMAYYQIAQVYGLMETMALAMALGILYCIFEYRNGIQEKQSWFHGALLLFLGICFVHERYLALFPLLYFPLVLRRPEKYWDWVKPAAVLLFVLAVRFFATGGLVPAGTGGTEVTDTFSVLGAVGFALDQVAYVFGINAGPSYLNGLTWSEAPALIHGLVYGADVVLAAMVLAFVVKLFQEKEELGKRLSNLALFLLFVVLCIGSSSVTVRLEMRWVYVSYGAALLLFCYLCGVLAPVRESGSAEFKHIPQLHGGQDHTRHLHGDSAEANFQTLHPDPVLLKRKEVTNLPAICCVGGFLLYALLMFPVETFFRSQYPNLYFWENQDRYNSLADETYGRYGSEIFGKKIYILGNSYKMSDFTARTFFKTFDPERKAEGTEVIFCSDLSEIGLVKADMLVLREDPEHRGFQDITQFVKELKLKVLDGYYADNWMDETCNLELMTGKTGVIDLKFSFPGVLYGGETTKVSVNGKLAETVQVRENVYEVVLKEEPNRRVELRFEHNFYMEDASEQRGEKRLAVLAEITAD